MTTNNIDQLLDQLEGTEIAIVGMAGRFPGANDVDAFWRNIRDGVESITPIDDDTLRQRGVAEATLQDPGFVKVSSAIEDYDKFDAPFFDYNPREAEVMDPQQRVFLECSWSALENAGYDPERFDGTIGVYAGGTTSNYLLYNLATNRSLLGDVGAGQIDIGNGADFVATRASYKLNLRGPSCSVQSACSTSMVAVHMGVQALLADECDMVLAGGVSVHVDHDKGYRFEAGSILSAEGKVRAFDAHADGTVFGSGVGVVVLKRLENALQDGDTIYAVIKGTAMTNDGSDKVGFVAPSVEGQAAAIAEALSLAGVDAATIDYVETHGAGTNLGDPIEIRALTKAFRTSTQASGYCAIGSVKTNIGHLTGAAGIAGLMRATLAMHHKTLPPTLNFEIPNPEIDFQNSPFFPNTQAKKWERNGHPRRAGVSSFGLGGTNVHAILEEPPNVISDSQHRKEQLLVLSGKTREAVAEATANLARYLTNHPDINLGDVAYTLQVGRQPFAYRRAVVCRSVADGVEKFSGALPEAERVLDGQRGRAVVFLLGAEMPAFSPDTLLQEPTFADAIAHCHSPIANVWHSDHAQASEARAFLLGYGLGKLWESWGVTPQAMFGVGVGEITAAALAGVFTPAEGLRLVLASDRVQQAKLMQLSPPQKPYLSSVSGMWISIQQATDPDYYGMLGGNAGISELLKDESRLFLDFGNSGLVRDAWCVIRDQNETPTTHHADLSIQLIPTLGKLWQAGVRVDWQGFYGDEQRRRIPLPTYPFARLRYWIEPGAGTQVEPAPTKIVKQADVADWFYVPTWSSGVMPKMPAFSPADRWLIITNHSGQGDAVAHWLRQQGQVVFTAKLGDKFAREGDDFGIMPASATHFTQLFHQIGDPLHHILHFGGLDDTSQTGFYALATLLQTMTGQPKITTITHHAQAVLGNEALNPTQAAVWGLCQVAPQEYAGLVCRALDMGGMFTPAQIVAEHLTGQETFVAYRGGKRWVQDFIATPLMPSDTPLRQLRHGGVYLVTGGSSDIGLDLAKYVAGVTQGHISLVEDAGVSSQSNLVAQLKNAGATSVTFHQIDLSDGVALGKIVRQTIAQQGALHGVIHAPSIPGEQAFTPIVDIKPSNAVNHFLPKVGGAMALQTALHGIDVDFVLLTSALSTALGGVGFSTFTGVAHVLNGMAQANGLPWLSINWDVWGNDEDVLQLDKVGELGQLAIMPAEGGKVLSRLLSEATESHLLVSTGNLKARLAQLQAKHSAEASNDDRTMYDRPDLITDYVPARDETEDKVVSIWESVLGIQPIGIHDNFFDLGGHSLLATQLRNHIHDKFHIEIPLRSLFDNATAEGVAQLVKTAQAQADEFDQMPIGDRLREAFPTERPAIMQEYLTRRLATGLNIPLAEFPEDGDLSGFDMQLPAVDLMWNLKRDLKVQFYPHELMAQTRVDELTEYVLRQKERMDNLPAFATDKPLSTYTIRPHAHKRNLLVPTEKNPPMVFLLSGPRSGSTLLRVMLAGHPDIFCPPEISLLFFQNMQEWQANVSFGQDFQWPAEGLHWALVEAMGLEPEEGWAKIQQLVQENRTVQSVYGQIQSLVTEKWVVDKTPPYAMDLETLQRAEQLFDKPRYIHLVRHPYAMMESFLRVRLDQQFSGSLFEEVNPDPYIIAETIWATTNRNLLRFFAEVDPAQVFFVRYEDLVKDPRTTMTKMAEFLEMPFTEKLITPYDGNRERMMGGIGDPNILQHKGIDPKLADVWRNIKLPRALDPTTKAIATQLGYELPDNVERPSTTLNITTMVETDTPDVTEMSDADVEAMLAQLMQD